MISYFFGVGKFGKKQSIFIFPFLAITTIPFALAAFIVRVFGRFDLTAVIFHFTARMGEAGIKPILEFIAIFSVLTFLLLWSVHYLVRRDSRFRILDRVLFLPLLFATPFFYQPLNWWVSSGMDGPQLSDQFADPQMLKGLEPNKQNVIFIYLESIEETFGKIPSPAPIFDDLDSVGTRGLRVSGMKEAADTGWTIAGLISTQCGIPLQPIGFVNRNVFRVMSTILPRALCLSDMLAQKGYNTHFFQGNSIKFAGTEEFLKSHQYNEIYGPEKYEAEVGKYRNSWGLFDDTLFDKAVEHVDELSKQAKPYLFTMFTIGGHAPLGFIDKTCRSHFGDNGLDPVRYAVQCSGWLTRGFLDELQRRGLLENTIVVIQNDHLSHRTKYAWDELVQEDRTNYFTLIGPNIEPKLLKKQATSFDVFPTVLEALGYELEHSRAGLGTSLLAVKPNLIERYGIDELDRMILTDVTLRSKFWDLK